MNLTFINQSLAKSLVATTCVFTLIVAGFFTLEPTVGRALTSPQTFKVTQSVTAEISFLTAIANVSMLPALAGITGGTAAGSTTVRVLTNNDIGYTMTIAFSSTTAMGRNGGGGVIANYNPTTVNVPDYTFSPEVFSQFGYTVLASTTADLATSFKDNGSACNTGSADVSNKCWLNPSTTAKTIINRSTATLASGATTTLAFRVNIPLNPVPSVQKGTYVATATLTAIVN